jgi:hypothetical protein
MDEIPVDQPVIGGIAEKPGSFGRSDAVMATRNTPPVSARAMLASARLAGRISAERRLRSMGNPFIAEHITRNRVDRLLRADGS